jgi:hypothetical protein
MQPGATLSVISVVVALGPGCREYRVEYHQRPAFYEKAASDLPAEITLEDGTIVKYNSNVAQSTLGRSGDNKHAPFEIRQETQAPDGKTVVTLRALLPEHVLANTLTCVQKEEYQLLFEQMLAERTKTAYAEQEQGLEEFETFFRTHRHDLAATLTRMVAGLPTQEVSIMPLGDGVTRCKLRPQIADPFKFKIVDVVKEGQQFRLLMIR